MGESRGGGGTAPKVRASNLIASLLDAYKDEDREVAQIQFVRLSEGQYELRCWIHGETEPDGIFTWNEGAVQEIESSQALSGIPVRERSG